MKLLGIISSLFALIAPLASGATTLTPDIAIANARQNCGQISNSFKSMKTMAQINTAVTGVGTAAGAGATIAGIVKANTDKKIENLIKNIKHREESTGVQTMTVDESQDFADSVITQVSGTSKSDTPTTLAELEHKSKQQGNIRTGLLATNTATNIAGAIIAANNKTDASLREQIERCNQSIYDLQDSMIQARIDNADSAIITKMDNIINACRDYKTLDTTQIDNKATGATISSGTGAVVGLAGTITSATANSDKIRNDNSDAGMAKEKNLNTASNVLAAGATVASGVATVFNAQQINTLNRAQQIATKCSEALNQ
ncbi:MAG: hypothetical protein NC311_03780 [Muribaculaceae bacterium]|nr:hypothetical protein [Muribaculaceae bacterium]